MASTRWRWRRLRQLTAIGLSVSLSGLSALPGLDRTAMAAGDTRSISLYFGHTKESISVTYKRDGKYLSSGLRKLNKFLRDWRADESTDMDPELIDLLWQLHHELGSKEPIHVISAYRSAKTNAMLKKIGRNVAKRSMHIHGKAIDVYFPDVPLKRLRENALLHEVGGVGYYPRSGKYGFVHIDTGRVRHWPRMSEQQLADLFRNKKTLTQPRRESPIQIAKAEQAEVPLPRAKPLYLAQNVVATPVSAPNRSAEEPDILDADKPAQVAVARIDTRIRPTPQPPRAMASLDAGAVLGRPTPVRTEPLLDDPAPVPALVTRLDQPARPTVSLGSRAPVVMAAATRAPDILPEHETTDRRSIFPLSLLRRSANRKIASLSPDLLAGDPSDQTASIGKAAAPVGLLSIDRAHKGDLLGDMPTTNFAVIELTGDRHMIVNRTNKGDFLGRRRADVSEPAPRLAGSIIDPIERAAPAASPVAIAAAPAMAAKLAQASTPAPGGETRSLSDRFRVLASIQQLFR